MTLAALLAVVLTVCLAVGGIFKAQAWRTIPKLWAPWWSHWRVWKWSWMHFRDPVGNPSTNMEELAAQEVDKTAANMPRRVRREMPVIYPEDVFAAMLVALEGLYFVFVVGLIVVSLGSFGAVKGIPLVFHSDARPQPVAILPTITHNANQAQQQKFDLSPLVTDEKAGELRTQPGVNNFAVIDNNGSVKYSAAWTVNPTDPGWTPAYDSSYITQSTLTGTSVTFKDQHDNEFTLNVGQPIYFPGNTAIVFMFDAHGQLMQAPRDGINKVSLSTVHSTVAVNSHLSIL